MKYTIQWARMIISIHKKRNIWQNYGNKKWKLILKRKIVESIMRDNEWPAEKESTEYRTNPNECGRKKQMEWEKKKHMPGRDYHYYIFLTMKHKTQMLRGERVKEKKKYETTGSTNLNIVQKHCFWWLWFLVSLFSNEHRISNIRNSVYFYFFCFAPCDIKGCQQRCPHKHFVPGFEFVHSMRTNDWTNEWFWRTRLSHILQHLWLCCWFFVLYLLPKKKINSIDIYTTDIGYWFDFKYSIDVYIFSIFVYFFFFVLFQFCYPNWTFIRCLFNITFICCWFAIRMRFILYQFIEKRNEKKCMSVFGKISFVFVLTSTISSYIESKLLLSHFICNISLFLFWFVSMLVKMYFQFYIVSFVCFRYCVDFLLDFHLLFNEAKRSNFSEAKTKNEISFPFSSRLLVWKFIHLNTIHLLDEI